MPQLSPGWATDLAVLELSGSIIEDKNHHWVVRTRDNPSYHWGNFVFVRDADSVDDAARWVGVFRAAFPDAKWVSIGLIREPTSSTAWEDAEAALELDEVLTTGQLPRQPAVPAGYDVRKLGGGDWEQLVQRGVAENACTQKHEPRSHEAFVRARTDTRVELSERGVAVFFGAFHEDRLVAELGIVRCGTIARYQDVGTDPQHRRRGLASHLLGVAGAWAGERGCDQWVIVTEATNPAGRVYRRAGFAPDQPNAQAYRPPPR